VVVPLRVTAVQKLHSGGEIGAGAFDEQVVVRVHEAKRVETPAEPPDDQPEQGEEVATIVVVAEERDLRHSAGEGVVDAVREDRTRQARHPFENSAAATQNPTCGQTVTLS
jgi:hypothetical protein